MKKFQEWDNIVQEGNKKKGRRSIGENFGKEGKWGAKKPVKKSKIGDECEFRASNKI